MPRTRSQGVFWLLTIPRSEWEAPTSLPAGTSWIKGQAEVGAGGYEHWQVFVAYAEKKTLVQAKQYFPNSSHLELSRSEAASDYVWKEDTAVAGTRFEYGAKPFRRNARTDWEEVWGNAVAGNFAAIPASVRVQSYNNLNRIRVAHLRPLAMERTCEVFWGPTGTGKSRKAWDDAGDLAYPKDPRTKFWDGYQGEEFVIIDEFDGTISICSVLRWLDRYPVRVEVKGSALPLNAKKFWITSNIDPDLWWPDSSPEQKLAFRRRVKVTQFHQL